MKEKLLIVADLGRLKAYRMEESRQYSHPRLELVDDWQTNVTQHLSAEVTDQAGQFRKGPSGTERQNLLSDGEEHNLDLERRRRAVRALAQRIGELLNREHSDGWYLAADRQINERLLEEIKATDRAKIQKNITVNLSKLSPEEVLKHFCD